MTSAGFGRRSDVVVETPLGQAARPEVLDDDVAPARPAARRGRGPRAVAQVGATERLLRAIAGHHRLSPSMVTPQRRIGSPSSGASTLITSAP